MAKEQFYLDKLKQENKNLLEQLDKIISEKEDLRNKVKFYFIN